MLLVYKNSTGQLWIKSGRDDQKSFRCDLTTCYLAGMRVEFAWRTESPTSYACRGPSHIAASCACRLRHVLYARMSRSDARPQPAIRIGSVDTMSSPFTGSAPELPPPDPWLTRFR
jgi:hypothetical protein